jgi:hypothetical protein
MPVVVGVGSAIVGFVLSGHLLPAPVRDEPGGASGSEEPSDRPGASSLPPRRGPRGVAPTARDVRTAAAESGHAVRSGPQRLIPGSESEPSAALDLAGEASNSMIHAWRWIDYASPEMRAAFFEESSEGLLETLRMRLEFLKPLGPEPWQDVNFQIVRSGHRGFGVVGRDFRVATISIGGVTPEERVTFSRTERRAYEQIVRRVLAMSAANQFVRPGLEGYVVRDGIVHLIASDLPSRPPASARTGLDPGVERDLLDRIMNEIGR